MRYLEPEATALRSSPLGEEECPKQRPAASASEQDTAALRHDMRRLSDAGPHSVVCVSVS